MEKWQTEREAREGWKWTIRWQALYLKSPRRHFAPDSRSAKQRFCLKHCVKSYYLDSSAWLMQYPSWSSENIRIKWLQSAEHYGNLPFIQPLRSQNVTIKIINNSHVRLEERNTTSGMPASNPFITGFIRAPYHRWPERLSCVQKSIRRENYFGPLTSKSVVASISIFSTARSWFISVTDCIASASAW